MKFVFLAMAVVVSACGAGSDARDQEGSAVYTEATAENLASLSSSLSAASSVSEPAEEANIYTESVYADVVPSDLLKIIFLIDGDMSLAEQRKKLSTELPSLLRNVINSGWEIAITALNADSYPKTMIDKYKNTFDYENKFASLVTNLQKGDALQGEEKKNLVRAFIIFTAEDLSTETQASLDKMLAGDHVNRVYGLVNMDRVGNFLAWKDEDGDQRLNRYGSVYSEKFTNVLEEISQDIAAVLRRNFFLKGYESVIVGRVQGEVVVKEEEIHYDGDYLDLQLTVNGETGGNTGYLNSDVYTTRDRLVTVNSLLTDNMCLEMTYSTNNE